MSPPHFIHPSPFLVQPLLLANLTPMQEQLDRKNSRTKQDSLQAKRFRDRLILRLQGWVDDRFSDLLALAAKTGEYNTTVRYDQYDNVIIEVGGRIWESNSCK